MVKQLIENNLQLRNWELIAGLKGSNNAYKYYRKDRFVICIDRKHETLNVIAGGILQDDDGQEYVHNIGAWVSFDKVQNDDLLNYLVLNY